MYMRTASVYGGLIIVAKILFGTLMVATTGMAKNPCIHTRANNYVSYIHLYLLLTAIMRIANYPGAQFS